MALNASVHVRTGPENKNQQYGQVLWVARDLTSFEAGISCGAPAERGLCWGTSSEIAAMGTKGRGNRDSGDLNFYAIDIDGLRIDRPALGNVCISYTRCVSFFFRVHNRDTLPVIVADRTAGKTAN